MVGQLYPEDDDARRDAGFSIFYMGINIGAFLAPLIVGWLAQGDRWHLGFGAAAVGMALGLWPVRAGQAEPGRASATRPGLPLTRRERRHFGFALRSPCSRPAAGWAAAARALHASTPSPWR